MAAMLPNVNKIAHEDSKEVYYIGTYDITNPEVFKNYPPKVAELLPKYGGVVLASDIEATCLEGKARTMNAVIKFPSMEAALGMYNDPEYQKIKKVRLSSTSNGTLVLAKSFKK